MTKEEVESKSVSGLIKELEEIKDKFGDVSLNFCKCKMLSSAVDEKATCYANRIDCLQQGEMCLTYGDLEEAYKEGYNQCIEDMRTMLDVKANDQWIDCEGTQIKTTAWCDMPHTKE